MATGSFCFLLHNCHNRFPRPGLSASMRGGEEKPEWPSQDFTKNRQRLQSSSHLSMGLSLSLYKRIFSRFYKNFTKNRQLATCLPSILGPHSLLVQKIFCEDLRRTGNLQSFHGLLFPRTKQETAITVIGDVIILKKRERDF